MLGLSRVWEAASGRTQIAERQLSSGDAGPVYETSRYRICADTGRLCFPRFARVVDYVEPMGEDHRLSWWTRWTTQQCRNCGNRSAYRQWPKELIHRDRQHKTFRYRCPQCNESFLKTENVGDGGFYG